jgi:hypothetical protein
MGSDRGEAPVSWLRSATRQQSYGGGSPAPTCGPEGTPDGRSGVLAGRLARECRVRGEHGLLCVHDRLRPDHAAAGGPGGFFMATK